MNAIKAIKAITIMVLLSCTPLAASADTRSVDTELRLEARPEAVLDAFLDQADLAAWWKVSRALVERETGGVWSIAWDDWGDEKTQHTWSGIIEELTPNRLVIGRLVMNEPGMPLMGPMQIDIEVSPAGDGTLLRLSHRGYRYGGHWDRMYELVVRGWDHVLGDMAAWFEADY